MRRISAQEPEQFHPVVETGRERDEDRRQGTRTADPAPTYSLREDIGLLYTAKSGRRRNVGSKIQALHLM